MVLFLALACTPDPVATLSPGSGSMSGYYAVDVETDLDVRGAMLAGVRTYGLTPVEGGYRLYVQGAPTAGPADLVLDTPDGPVTIARAFAFDEPLVSSVRSIAGIGASLTQGVQGGVPTQHGQLHSPTAQLARRLGVYHPLPLLVEPLFPAIDADAIGPPPDCEVPDVATYVASSAVEVITRINDEEQDRIGFYLARVDPDLLPHNVAVGSTNLRNLAYGPDPDDFAQQFLAHLVYDPYGDIAADVPMGQLDLVDEIAPDVIVCADTYGNDLIGAIVESETVQPELLTPLDELEAALVDLAERLHATGAEVFLANMPRPTLLPLTQVKRQAALDAGDSEEAVDTRLAEIDAMGQAYNDLLDREAARFENLHVVDLYGAISDLEDDGLVVGGQDLSVKKFGGLLSTDGVHFSDVGYALVANLVIEEMNEVLGTDLGLVDLDGVIEDDQHSPRTLTEAGLDIDACAR